MSYELVAIVWEQERLVFNDLENPLDRWTLRGSDLPGGFKLLFHCYYSE